MQNFQLYIKPSKNELNPRFPIQPHLNPNIFIKRLMIFHINALQLYLLLIIRQFDMKKMNFKQGNAPSEQQTQLYDKITKIEVSVLQRIQKLKNNAKSSICEHFNFQTQECQPYDQSVNYYDKFWKRLMLNQIGRKYVQELQENLHSFQRKLQKIDGLFVEWEKSVKPVTRGKQKQFKMKEEQTAVCHECGKTYKDEQTLMLHVRIKHQIDSSKQKRPQKQNDRIFEEQSD